MASLEPDRLLDRRRLKRGVAIWRALAIVALVAAALVGAMPFAFDEGERVARLWVSGFIEDDPGRDRIVADLRNDDTVKAVVLRLDSAGGTAVGGEALYLSLRSLAEKKPVVAVLGTTATSAAYMAALAADRLLARESSLTGSIGVLFQTAEFTALLEEIGVRAEAIRSGPLKAKPMPYEELDDPTRQAVRSMVSDIYEYFLRLLMERRSLDRETALTLADGRVFTGRQAVRAGLVDAIGGEEEARAWLAQAHGVPKSVPATDVTTGDESGLLGTLDAALKRSLPVRTLALDGLIAVWHPELSD
ncbi:MAG: signal peptide peptidase SppA [Rhodospirillales bacterium]|nr:signal peptide peptidase SppA [Rhodospirillales bacterium]